MTKQQAEELAKQIFDEFDPQIDEAVKGTSIPSYFIAGLIGNEAGKDKSGKIKRSATRFEPGIYAKLKRVASTRGATFGQIKHSDLADATDASLRALATSYEATQMMGYWCIVLGCTLADLKNPDKHFFYTVKLLQLNGFPSRPTETLMDNEMRQWNTGREQGKTYHANYVPNAQKIRAAYKALEKSRAPFSINSAADSTPTPDTASEPTGSNDSDTPQTSQDQPPTKIVDQQGPEPYQGIGFWGVIKRDLKYATGGNLSFAGVSEYAQQASGWPEWVVALIGKVAVGALIATFGYFIFRVVHYFVDSWKQKERTRLLAEINTNPNRHDLNLT